MKINIFSILLLTFLIALSCKNEKAPATTDPAPANSEWVELINGKDMTGWKSSTENVGTWTVVDGMLQAVGKRNHLFYVGDQLKDSFKNFELIATVKTFPLANSGIYFHTHYQETGWPSTGMEIQVNNSHIGEGDYAELKKAGSLYGIRNVYKSFVEDNEWYETRALVEGKHVQIWLNGLKTVDYTEPDDFNGKKLSSGTFCLQGHDSLSKMQYKSFKVRRLPDDAVSNTIAAAFGPWQDSMAVLQSRQFAFIDLNPHTDLSTDALVVYCYQSGINVSIVRDPAQAAELNNIGAQPVFKGIRVNALTIDTHQPGSEDYTVAESKDLKEARALLSSGKINIWSHHGEALTTKNASALIDLAKKNSVAIEIDNEARTPSAEVLKLAKAKGCKFTFANLVPASKMDASMYVIEVLKAAGMTYKDLYVPKGVM
ncbi:MAG: DUF1080 domain-containing protein [Saprospiraceae bacterium]|nr:DUF1080 domain-containing protein [Saprospiraceae bacterium]